MHITCLIFLFFCILFRRLDRSIDDKEEEGEQDDRLVLPLSACRLKLPLPPRHPLCSSHHPPLPRCQSLHLMQMPIMTP